jgi:hypothetical protein
MKYRVWFSTETFADYIIAKTSLSSRVIIKKKMYESDANNSQNFHTLPDHIKKILYLDAPDIIVELDSEPIFSIEISTEAGTGHNAFQRFARLAASVENDVPAFYIYPEAALITRKQGQSKTKTDWDKINPQIFKALEDVMTIYKIPALLYYFPSQFRSNSANTNISFSDKGLRYDADRRNFPSCPDSTDSDMRLMFDAINETIQLVEQQGVIGGRNKLLSKRVLSTRKSFMQQEFAAKNTGADMSPITATEKIPTLYLLNYLARHHTKSYSIGELLKSRNETIIYKVDAKFRSDPYPGALAAIDYLLCREGKTFEERKYNLVMCWGKLTIDHKNATLQVKSNKVSINDFFKDVKSSECKNILDKEYSEIKSSEISRYYMQVRYGSMFSKVKHIRVISYFADAILFPDGDLWRDA